MQTPLPPHARTGAARGVRGTLPDPTVSCLLGGAAWAKKLLHAHLVGFGGGGALAVRNAGCRGGRALPARAAAAAAAHDRRAPFRAVLVEVGFVRVCVRREDGSWGVARTAR